MYYLPAPACSICNRPALHHQYNDKPVCDDCQHQIGSYALKVQSRAERLYNRADKMNAEASAGWDRATQMQSVIPFGQPILIGHHSEKSDRAYRDRIWNTQKRAYEKGKYAEELNRRAEAAEKNRAISSDDPAAVLKLKEKLATLQATQEQMVGLNKAIRKLIPHVEQMKTTGHHGTVEEINSRFRAEKERVAAIHSQYVNLAPELATLAGISETLAVKLLMPDMLGQIGIPAYALKNNGAEIRRCLKRIDELQAQRTTIAANAVESIYGDIRLERSADDNRLRLHFPGKPSREVIAILKQNGFKWSPTNTAWQRQLNASAEYAALQVIRYAQEQKAS